MGTISLNLPSDGETIDAADVNTPFTTIKNVINGNIDGDNVASDIATLTGTQTLTNKTLTSPVIRNFDGWQDANETWTFASAVTITVPAGATSKYSVGDKIKLTANSVVLYAYVVIVANTLLTVVGDALTNHTFSANYYSKQTSPVGFPQWFDWTPSYTTSSGAFTNAPSTQLAKFSIKGKTFFWSNHFTLNATSGGSNVILITGLPVAPEVTYVPALVVAPVAGYLGTGYVDTTPKIGIYKYDGNSIIVNSLIINCNGFYKIA